MAQRTKDILKTYFETGDKPTQSQFEDLIDSLQPSINTELLPFVTKDDGSVYLEKIGVVADIGAYDYDPASSTSALSYSVSMSDALALLQAYDSVPVIIRYTYSRDGENDVLAYHASLRVQSSGTITLEAIAYLSLSSNRLNVLKVDIDPETGNGTVSFTVSSIKQSDDTGSSWAENIFLKETDDELEDLGLRTQYANVSCQDSVLTAIIKALQASHNYIDGTLTFTDKSSIAQNDTVQTALCKLQAQINNIDSGSYFMEGRDFEIYFPLQSDREWKLIDHINTNCPVDKIYCDDVEFSDSSYAQYLNIGTDKLEFQFNAPYNGSSDLTVKFSLCCDLDNVSLSSSITVTIHPCYWYFSSYMFEPRSDGADSDTDLKSLSSLMYDGIENVRVSGSASWFYISRTGIYIENQPVLDVLKNSGITYVYGHVDYTFVTKAGEEFHDTLLLYRNIS